MTRRQGEESTTAPIAVPGRRMLRIEARNSGQTQDPKPAWIRVTARESAGFRSIAEIVDDKGLHTVCREAGCPNVYECWENREATFLIGGDRCTRRCDFCQIDTGRPLPLDPAEPGRVAESVQLMGLRYATVTGVARDDLSDRGAWLYAETVRQIHARNPGVDVELLAPDFNGEPGPLTEVFGSRPQVFAHNIETVRAEFRRVRPGFSYDRSLDVLAQARSAALVTKSNLILGLGERPEDVTETMQDLRAVGCMLLTITQYLRPSPMHHPVTRWVRPEEFISLKAAAEDMGFAGVMAGPLVRSSYKAGELFRAARSALDMKD